MKKIIIIILSLIVIQYIVKNNQINDLKKDLVLKQKQIDSLSAEIYPIEIELNRYEITLEKIMEKDSACGILFETTKSMETE
jgi:hypothetical protein